VLPAWARRRRSAMAAAEPSYRSTHLFGRVTIPTPCLGPIEAQSLACCPAFRRTSPDAQTQQQPPTPSVGRARRRRYHPDSDHQHPRGSPCTPSLPFAGRTPARPRRNSGDRAAPLAQGPDCKGSFLSMGRSAKQGLFYKTSILSRDLAVKLYLQ
jgi:hypothetical protein